MINQDVVRIIAERIMDKGMNPKTKQVFNIRDIKHFKYKMAIEKYIIQHSKGI